MEEAENVRGDQLTALHRLAEVEAAEAAVLVGSDTWCIGARQDLRHM